MNNLLFFIGNNSSIVLAGAIFAVAVLLIISTLLWWQTIVLKRRLKVFFQSREAKDFESLIAQQIKRQMKSEKEIKELFQSSRDLWRIALKSIHKVGVVRFNPFKDTGGDQSFVIALLDAGDSGVVISSLFTREGTRIYAKPIRKGQSKYPLSKEEEMAIAKAKGKK